MSGQFEGRTALVTGGGTGIGRASALALAAEGAVVTVAGRTEATLAETVDQITTAGGFGRYVVCDVTDEDAVRAAVSAAVGDSGRLDFAVNSAGIDGGNLQWPTVEYPNATFDAMMATNVNGMFYSMKHELVPMLAQGHGSLVNIASSAGLIGTTARSCELSPHRASVARSGRSPVRSGPAGESTRSGARRSVDHRCLRRSREDALRAGAYRTGRRTWCVGPPTPRPRCHVPTPVSSTERSHSLRALSGSRA